MDYVALKTEIVSGPLAAALAEDVQSQQWGSVAARLNVRDGQMLSKIGRHAFATWCGATGLRAIVQDHADNAQSPLRSIALTILDFLRGSLSDNLDLTQPENQQMLAAWHSAGAITDTQLADLEARATVAASRAEIIGLGMIAWQDVQEALK
jgi:hypothetical protein